MAAEKLTDLKKRVQKTLKILKQVYPEARCSLSYRNPFELLAATILSAQCTDARVNKVTPILFKKYGDPRSMSGAPLKELEDIIRSTGFYKNKALSLKHMAEGLVSKHEGEVPATVSELTALRGVGRKTANVVLGNAFGIPSLVVDTHVTRLSRRLGFTRERDPVKIEMDMRGKVEESDWTLFAQLLISHGRSICMARAPRCGDCPVERQCPKIGVVLKKSKS